MSDIDDDGIPDSVERLLGQDLVGPKDLQRIAAVKEIAGRVVDATEQAIASVVGQDAVDVIADTIVEGLGAPPVSMRLPDDPPARRVELTKVREDASIEDFIVNVLAQVGDRYQRGVDNSLRDADPDSWDGSELVEWGANRAGSMVNDGAQNQYKQMVRHDGDVSVDIALVTPGAVLYEFTGDPNGSAKPTRASTAISLGDGKHIIDIDPVHGVRIVEAKDFRFTHAGVMPGFVDSHNPGPMTGALVEDALRAAGLEPGPALQVVTAPPTTAPDAVPDATPAKDQTPTEPTDDEHGPEVEVPPANDDGSPPPPGLPAVPPDTAEITALAGRAAQLRARYIDKMSSPERVDIVAQRDDLGLQSLTMTDAASWSKRQLESRLESVRERSDAAIELDRRASEAQAAGRTRDAEELGEQAEAARGTAKAFETLAERSRVDLAKAEAEVARLDREHAVAHERLEQSEASRRAAEEAIDVVEEKVRLLREAEAHEQRASGYDGEAQWFRDHGDPQEADRRAALASKARADADAARDSSRLTVVDESALRESGILTSDETLGTVPPLPPVPSDQATPSAEETPRPSDPSVPEEAVADQAASLEARAKALRTELIERQAVDRADDLNEVTELSRRELEARAGAEEATVVTQIRESQAEEARQDVTRLQSEARAAVERGDSAAGEELLEQADLRAATAKRLDTVARDSAGDASRRLAEADAVQVERLQLTTVYKQAGVDLTAAEAVIDQIEAKAKHLREAGAHAERAVDLESEAALLRDQGKTVEADAKHAAAAQARSAGRHSETLAAAQPIDEAKLTEAGLLGGPTTTETSPPESSLLDDVTGAETMLADVAGAAEAVSPAVADEEATDGDPADAEIADVIDAHALAESLVPDTFDEPSVASAGGDPWGDTTADDEAAPTRDDDPTPDLEG